MKRLAAFVVCLVLLSGCSADTAIEKPMTLRNRLMNSNGFSFVATIIADYGEKYYEFEMDCQVQTSGELSFSVSKPESISGISGTVTEKGASLKFDDKVLAFEMLADDQITPVIAPWLTVRALLSGYIHAVGRDGALYQAKAYYRKLLEEEE